MYAVIKTGGKQYRVAAGDLIKVEKLEGEAGAAVTFNDVLMIGDEAGAVVGAPLVDGAAVEATLIETRKGEKVRIFKKIRRHYHTIEIVSGVLMIVIGVLIFTNRFTIIAQWLTPYLPSY